MDFQAFLRYWSLTLAVFVIYAFMFLAAVVDVGLEVAETIRKRRDARKGQPPPVQRNPLQGTTLAQTIEAGPGQQPDEKRAWVRAQLEGMLTELGIKARTLVLEDSKHHPFVQVFDDKKVVTYRVSKEAVDKGRAGDTHKIEEIRDFLRRHLAADFLGKEDMRPPRTTELAREASAKPAPKPAAAAPAAPTAGQTAAPPAGQTAAPATTESPEPAPPKTEPPEPAPTKPDA